MEKDKPVETKKLRAFIKFSLSTRGMTFTSLANAHRMSLSNLTNCFYNGYPKGETILSHALGFEGPWILWPHRWYKDEGNDVWKTILSRNRKASREKIGPDEHETQNEGLCEVGEDPAQES